MKIFISTWMLKLFICFDSLKLLLEFATFFVCFLSDLHQCKSVLALLLLINNFFSDLFPTGLKDI